MREANPADAFDAHEARTFGRKKILGIDESGAWLRGSRKHDQRFSRRGRERSEVRIHQLLPVGGDRPDTSCDSHGWIERTRELQCHERIAPAGIVQLQ
jgi:hypothetical protein